MPVIPYLMFSLAIRASLFNNMLVLGLLSGSVTTV